jgi:hypothetical protein
MRGRKYDSSQPRALAGNSHGDEWVSGTKPLALSLVQGGPEA